MSFRTQRAAGGEASTVDLRAVDGGTAGTVELPGDVFGVQANIPLMHQVVVAQLAAARRGTAKAKTRAEVSGGGRKPYKQKGTGRARQGSLRAPQFTGGGASHGPVPRDYAQRTPKKMKAAALRGALSDRAREGRVHVVESFVDGDTPHTRTALATLRSVTEATTRVLVVLGISDEVNWVSLRNVPEVHLLAADQLNTYDVLVSDQVVFTQDALAEFLGVPLEIDASTASAAPAPRVTGEGEGKVADQVSDDEDVDDEDGSEE